MFHITSSPHFKSLFPLFKGAAILAKVRNSETSEALKADIITLSDKIQQQFTTQTIKERKGIIATRQAYKIAGKDPSRYRPACEQLARRIIQGKGLYYVNTIVDIVNYASLYSACSTAALDADHLEGNNIELDFGQAGEPYEGIGRGTLNIEHLPVYRDSLGGFATPTSDSTRTMTSLDTENLLILINGYDGDHDNLKATVEVTVELLRKYAACQNFEIAYY